MPAKEKGQLNLKNTKNTTTYGHGGPVPMPRKKMKIYKRGGESGTPKSLPGGCGGRRKK